MRGRLAVLTVVALAVCALVVPTASAHSKYHMKVLVRGAPIHGANGLAVDKAGRLLVASGLGCEILALDRQTGHILKHILPGDVSPDDVATGPDGSIYWTDFPSGQVGRLAPDGTVTRQTVAPGMNPIAFNAQGRLFVGQAFAGDGLYELDPDLVDPPRVVIPSSGLPPFMNQLNGFDFGPDGMLYSPQPFFMRVVKIDPETGAIDPKPVADFSSKGWHPGSVEFDARGRLYASLADALRIVRIDMATGAYQVLARIRSGQIDNMAFDARDRLFFSNSYTGAVYTATARGVRTISRGGLMLPGGIALKKSGSHESLFVADMWRLIQFDARSGRQLGIDQYSPVGSGIIHAWTVAPYGGQVLLSSFMEGAVQLWDPASKKTVSVFAPFTVPLNAIGFQGDVVVSEAGPDVGRVVRVDAETQERTTIMEGFALPVGLAASDGDLYVSDWFKGGVYKIVSDGSILSEWQLIAALGHPEGMAVDRAGRLLVMESGKKRLVRIDPGTGHMEVIAGDLKVGVEAEFQAGPPSWAIASVAVGSHGTIYVTGDAGGGVYRLRPTPQH